MQRPRKIALPLSALALFAAACASFTRAPSSAGTPFASMVAEISAPQLYFSNDAAFAARLKLLDFAPTGSRALISTFVFDNGEVVREFAPHVCEAARRGVSVRLLVDSKSGGQAGIPDLFNRKIGRAHV